MYTRMDMQASVRMDTCMHVRVHRRVRMDMRTYARGQLHLGMSMHVRINSHLPLCS